MLHVLVLTITLLASSAGSAVGDAWVLALFSDERAMPAVIEIETAVRTALGLPDATVEYSGEFLDAARFENADSDAIWVDFLRRKYAGRDIRALVAVSAQALDFLIKHQREPLSGSAGLCRRRRVGSRSRHAAPRQLRAAAVFLRRRRDR